MSSIFSSTKSVRQLLSSVQGSGRSTSRKEWMLLWMVQLTLIAGVLSDVHIECNSNNIMVTLASPNFNGMIYPKGLSKNSSCMVEYTQVSNVTYMLPLRSCNTMSANVVSLTRKVASRERVP